MTPQLFTKPFNRMTHNWFWNQSPYLKWNKKAKCEVVTRPWKRVLYPYLLVPYANNPSHVKAILNFSRMTHERLENYIKQDWCSCSLATELNLILLHRTENIWVTLSNEREKKNWWLITKPLEKFLKLFPFPLVINHFQVLFFAFPYPKSGFDHK